MPFECTNHALQCALDAGELGLWLGTMNTTCPLQRYCRYEREGAGEREGGREGGRGRGRRERGEGG